MDPVSAIAIALGRIAQSAGDITSSINQKKAAETSYMEQTALEQQQLFKTERPITNNSLMIAIVVLAMVFLILVVVTFNQNSKK